MPKTLIADAYHLNGFGTCEIQTLLALLSDTKIARIRELAAACASLDVSWIEVEDDDIIWSSEQLDGLEAQCEDIEHVMESLAENEVPTQSSQLRVSKEYFQFTCIPEHPCFCGEVYIESHPISDLDSQPTLLTCLDSHDA